MKFNSCPGSSLRWLTAATACFVLAISAASGQQLISSKVHGKATLHEDGTRTESVKDTTKREMSDTTYDARGVAVCKKTFLLNENGDAIQGVIYDGAGNLIARVQFFFDDLGRVVEERCVNTQNQIFRRVIRMYDPAGKPLPPKAFDYEVNAPNMRAATMDFTKRTSPSTAPEPVAATSDGTQTPQIMTVSPRTGARIPATAAPAAEAEKKKKGFFGFGKK